MLKAGCGGWERGKRAISPLGHLIKVLSAAKRASMREEYSAETKLAVSVSATPFMANPSQNSPEMFSLFNTPTIPQNEPLLPLPSTDGEQRDNGATPLPTISQQFALSSSV